MVPFSSQKEKGRVTAAGPLPTLTGFPIKPKGHQYASYVKMAAGVKEKWFHTSPKPCNDSTVVVTRD